MDNTKRDFIVGTTSVIYTHLNFIRDALCRNIENPSEHFMLDKMCEDMAMRLEEIEAMLLYPDEYNAAAKYYDPYDDLDFDGDVWVYDSGRKKHCMCDDCWSVSSDKYDHRMD